MISSSIIDFKNISIFRNDKVILDSFTLKIGIDENVAIIGPNGCGKSTFIKLIVKDIYPSYIEEYYHCKVFGEDNWSLEELRKKLGIVNSELQYSFNGEISGFDMIMSGYFGSYKVYDGFSVTGEMVDSVERMSKFLGIGGLINKYVNTMSSGEQRKFLIARALINNPKALILDEPTNSLDVHSIQSLKVLMSNIVNQNKNIILVTHTVSDIIPEIGRVIMIKDGKIFEDGRKSEVLKKEKLEELFSMKLELIENNQNYTISY
jgi:iron complex transport system ATP-binding protein